jgi:hypothetical protein
MKKKMNKYNQTTCRLYEQEIRQRSLLVYHVTLLQLNYRYEYLFSSEIITKDGQGILIYTSYPKHHFYNSF